MKYDGCVVAMAVILCGRETTVVSVESAPPLATVLEKRMVPPLFEVVFWGEVNYRNILVRTRFFSFWRSPCQHGVRFLRPEGLLKSGGLAAECIRHCYHKGAAPSRVFPHNFTYT